MPVPRQPFNDRLADLKALLSLAKDLETASTPGGAQEDIRYPHIESTSLAVLKATVFVVIYNLVEATVRGAFEWLYREMDKSGQKFPAFTKQVQQIWIRHAFLGGVDLYSASPAVFFGRITTLVTNLLNKPGPAFTGSELQVSGNLDADNVRKVFERHGLPFATPSGTSGGSDLSIVRTLRNNLAHGSTTFSECGRDYSTADLERIANQCEQFIRAVLTGIDSFARTKGYCTKDTAAKKKKKGKK